MTRIIDYEDLALAIEQEAGGGYRVRTLSSSYGAAAASFVLPLDREELERIIKEAEAGLLSRRDAGDPSPVRDLGSARPERVRGRDLQEIGSQLFQALFRGAIHETYLLSCGRADSHSDRGLRIRLVLPVDTPESGLLQALPWELMYCEKNGFLARNVLTPVVRQLWLGGNCPPIPTTESDSIRILIAVANPRGSSSLDDTDERARILQAWLRQQRAEVEILRPATLQKLHEELRENQFQVVHFIGHGFFDAESGEGSLLFETPEKSPHLVSSKVLAETLQASRELRLVFLNSCRSSTVGYRSGQDPLLGTASALVRRGVPAVLAMQAPISDFAAKGFSEGVYRSLARGYSLDSAVAEGRLSLYQKKPASCEWSIPAFFAALSDFSVFRPLCKRSEDIVAKQSKAVAEAAVLLKRGSYTQAMRVIDDSLEQGADIADLHYYWAIALLAGRRPRSLEIGALKPIEASARRVLNLEDCAAHHLCFLAFLQRDFYLENFLLPPKPTYEALLDQAAAARPERLRLDELVSLVAEAKAEVALVLQRSRSDSQ
jgi:hypothetical protein